MYFLLPAKQNQAENWIEFEDFAIELRWYLLLEVPFFGGARHVRLDSAILQVSKFKIVSC